MHPLDYRIVIGVMIAAALGCRGSEPLASRTAANASPWMQLMDLDGRPFNHGQGEPANIIVVIFTRTDCPISNRCAPEIRSLYEKYHPQGVEFFLIYADPRETPDIIRRHLLEYGLPCQALRDPKHALVAQCEVTTTPEAVVFNVESAMVYRGRVNDQYSDLGKSRAGAITHNLADAIEATVSGRPVAVPRTAAIGCSIEDLKD